ncbi:MAG: hypothetical protein QHC89_01715 [Bosea sp. (in: a-proteobacteria)]|nr:hypothetical protein [Bosea sp. (in: a-proteobacteria)]
MSGCLYLTRTVHMPVTADGCAIKNSFGVVIATAVDPMTAAALAEIVNLGAPAAAEADLLQQKVEMHREFLLSPWRKGKVEYARRRQTKGDAA